MKKALLSLSLLFSLAASSQTLNEANHSYVVGDLYSTVPCSTVGVIAGSPGANSIWNYASVTTNTASMVNYTTSLNANTTYTPADIVFTGSSSNTSYYKSSAADLKYYGGNLSINSYSVTLGYSTPAIYAIYPMSLNTTNTGSINGSVVILGNTATFSGQCKILADATGTLTVPSGLTYSNTIRVVTTQTIITSALPFVGVATIYLQNYDYYDPSTALVFKAPLFSISNSTLSSGAGTSAQTSASTLKDNNVGINESKKASIELTVYPNPAISTVNFSTTSTEAAKVLVYDITGELVSTEVLEMGKSKINVSSFASGVYIYRVVSKENRVLKSGKFDVTK